MKPAHIMAALGWLLAAGLALASTEAAQTPSPRSVAHGGRLYDRWWKAVAGVKSPIGDHPLWALQTTNPRRGEDTWRCKECHGWDYKGQHGTYGSGSRMTGFSGVLAARGRSEKDLKAILKGSANPKHDFSPMLDDAALSNLATFLKHGLVDLGPAISIKTGEPVKGDAVRGKQLFAICAICHGPEGTKLNFGNPDKPEYIGAQAREDPWMFVHKVRVGAPGSDPPMPTAIELGWKLQDILDVLVYSRTRP